MEYKLKSEVQGYLVVEKNIETIGFNIHMSHYFRWKQRRRKNKNNSKKKNGRRIKKKSQ